MFEIEFIGLINRYNKSSSSEEKEKIKEKLEKLILDNIDETKEFLKNGEITDSNIIELITGILQKIQNSTDNRSSLDENNQKNSNAIRKTTYKEVERIKQYYSSWLESFNKNSKQITPECSNIMNEIINLYVNSNFELIEEMLKIQDTQDYEYFKNHLRNSLRAHIGRKINSYLENQYKELSFFQKIKKKKEIKQIIKEIGNYKFDFNKIKEVLE